jgi:hypothetical protein
MPLSGGPGNDCTNRAIKCRVTDRGETAGFHLVDQVRRIEAGEFSRFAFAEVIGISHHGKLRHRDGKRRRVHRTADSSEEFAPPGDMAASSALLWHLIVPSAPKRLNKRRALPHHDALCGLCAPKSRWLSSAQIIYV